MYIQIQAWNEKYHGVIFETNTASWSSWALHIANHTSTMAVDIMDQIGNKSLKICSKRQKSIPQ
jgi:hypothetical protein